MYIYWHRIKRVCSVLMNQGMMSDSMWIYKLLDQTKTAAPKIHHDLLCVSSLMPGHI